MASDFEYPKSAAKREKSEQRRRRRKWRIKGRELRWDSVYAWREQNC